ncbi:SAM-dependent methyltransferase [Nocardia sp. NEAU-G5]|uniref:SAM-dependent methyltransferase n=1 Tax=Nocardia albiluteola TaxID=2842303 RepID=A0ABS6B4F7_9NOCA|nr:SAM-dependent methyltransferase [Nocardia albiluteola]MBU3064635.1 SAM-dependent methyltransferase [Nocardia albiluteola]
MSADRDFHPSGVDLRTDQAHSARIYDWFIGGKDNYEADQAAGAEIEKVYPTVRAAALANRHFMHRAVRHIAQAGVRQFLDIGTGLPTEPNLHRVAQAVTPDARVVYTDNDPLVLTHSRALMTGTNEGRVSYISADVTDPQSILDAAELRDTLDFSEPIALSMIALLHFVTDEHAYPAVRTLVDALPPGSYLILSHAAADLNPEQSARLAQAYHASGVPMELRDREQVLRLFDGLDFLEPGFTTPHRWRPDPADIGLSDQALADRDRDVMQHAAVARKP